MKHIVVSFLALTLFITTGCLAVFAEDSSSSGTRSNTHTQRKENQQERQEKFASRSADHKEKLASRSAELKERLATFKDKKKAEIALRISTTLNKINENRTDAMKKHLEKMTELLDKLDARVASKSAEGKDTTQADSAIASASAAIASASAAVDAQALNDYTINVSSESGVHTDAKTMRDKLHTDLEAVRKLVVDAKQSVAAAIRTAATTLGGIGEGKEATQGGSH